MKKVNLSILLSLLLCMGIFGSCNKKLKKEIEELDNSIIELKNSNSELQNGINSAQNQINNTSQLIGSNEPITATTTYVDDNNVTKTYTDTYYFKAGNYDTQYMQENNDGTYEIYIERFSDVQWYDGAWVFFNYNPNNQTITGKRCGQYWDWNLSYYSNTYFDETYTGCTIAITINSINISTGDISISVNAMGNSTYTSTYSGYVPNDIGSVSTVFSFTGKLKVFPLS